MTGQVSSLMTDKVRKRISDGKESRKKKLKSPAGKRANGLYIPKRGINAVYKLFTSRLSLFRRTDLPAIR